jgi:hypothetical protein
VNLGIGQPCGPFVQVFESQIERVQYRTAHRWNLVVSSAQPGFDIRSGH